MAVAANADDYANARIGIYFPGFPHELTGQCVSLDKWFLGEMCGIGDWQAARGNAKDFGDTLVLQGLATFVPAGQQKRGDLAVWKQDGAGNGHTGVVLSGGRIFEENVGLIGAPSIYVPDGAGGSTRVFAARIDPLYDDWRLGAPTFYRIKTYVENIGDSPMIIQNADNWFGRCNKTMQRIRGRDLGRDEFTGYAVGAEFLHWVEAVEDNGEADAWYALGQLGAQEQSNNWQGQVVDLQKQLNDEKDKDTVDEQKIADLTQQLNDAIAKLNAPIVPVPVVPVVVKVEKPVPATFVAAKQNIFVKILNFFGIKIG